MKTKRIYLEATIEDKQLMIACYESGETLFRKESSKKPLDFFTQSCHRITQHLNESTRLADTSSHNINEIKTNGRILYDYLLTDTCRNRLSETKAEFLVIKMDDSLVHLHWELIYDGEIFFCQRFSIGRVVGTQDTITHNKKRCLRQLPVQMGIIANPGGDLNAAGNEGLEIFKNATRLNQSKYIIKPHLESQIKHNKIQLRLKNYDMVHFAGHATYDPSQFEKCGWQLTDKNFTTEDINEMAGSSAMPLFIFSNACQSARSASVNCEKLNKGLLGLANAFLFSGVNHYIGTSLEIADDAGCAFAFAFYANLFTGKSIGESVKQARDTLIQQKGEYNFIWASYLLYGDPTTVYFPKDEKVIKRIRFKPSAYKVRSIRGLFNHSWNFDLAIKKILTLLFIIVTIGGIYLGYFYISNINKNKIMEIQKRLIQQAEKRQQRIDVLTKTLLNKWPDAYHYVPKSTDGWTSTQIPVIMMFDSNQFSQGRENIILFALQDEMLEKLTFIKLLERKSIDKLFEEWIKGNKKPDLTLPKLIIFLEVYEDDSKCYILMRLVEEWDQLIETIFEEIIQGSILKQKDIISQRLIQTMIEKYPIRGKITDVKNNTYTLNIGRNEGVCPGHIFKGIGKKYTFSVSSVGLNNSQLQLKSGDGTPCLELKIFMVNKKVDY